MTSPENVLVLQCQNRMKVGLPHGGQLLSTADPFWKPQQVPWRGGPDPSWFPLQSTAGHQLSGESTSIWGNNTIVVGRSH